MQLNASGLSWQVPHDAFRKALFDPVQLAELERYDQEVAYLSHDGYGRAMKEACAAEKRAVERLGLVCTS